MARGVLLLALSGCGDGAITPDWVERTDSQGGSGGGRSGPDSWFCPESEPEQGMPCADLALMCGYPACGRLNGSLWGCEKHGWNQIFAPGCNPEPPECPGALPEPDSDCGSGPRTCNYTRPCCGETVAVKASCVNGRWLVLDKNPDACPACRIAASGQACDQTPSCEGLICYPIECHGTQVVSSCTNGVWQTEAACTR